MRLAASPVPISIGCWLALVACLDAPLPEAPPSARIVVSWDPLACGAPHRVAIELQDEDGAAISSSAPCALGGLVLEAPHFGVYFGRVYAWSADQPIRSITPVRLHVDEPIVRWIVATPV
jgi:hypothetical protein